MIFFQLKGEWMGIVGDLSKDNAHFGPVLSISVERLDYIDFGIVYYFDPFTFITSKSRRDSQWEKIVVPLQGKKICLCKIKKKCI